jgi:hypothetical protein
MIKLKFCNILRNEGLKSSTSEEIGITADTAYDYRSGRSGPSAQNLVKIINAFPQYTCYILDLDPKKLPGQIILIYLCLIHINFY